MITSEKMPFWAISLFSGVFILTISGSLLFFSLFKNRIYPGIEINSIDVGGLTKDEAQQLLTHQSELPPNYLVNIQVDDIQVSSDSTQLKIEHNYNHALDTAYQVGRVGSPLKKLWDLTKTTLQPIELQAGYSYDQALVELLIKELKKQVDLEGHHPNATLKYSGSPYSLNIDPGKPGREVVTAATIQLVNDNIGDAKTIQAQVASTSAILNQEELVAAQEKATKLVNKRLIFKAEGVRLDLNDQKLISLLSFPEGFNQEKIILLLDEWQEAVNRPAQNAKFDFDEETLVVNEFIPPREGLELDREKTIQLIKTTIGDLLNNQANEIKIGINDQANIELELPVVTTQPEITLEKTNQLGIKERIGFGDSEYDHSIINRIHNVKITAEKINNTLIAPGEQFSFNKTLGEVSAKTGYRSAYVIKDGKTELGDGGGVCQVSTTIFRAVLDAGLEVTRRLPHSYRVSYYELNSKPGIDATVYSGETDFRFINDTDHYILVHANADSDNLYMKVEIFGTSDGRTTEIKDHEVWGYVPPLATQYYPNPSLPTGVKKQIDWAVAGIKAKFTHVIKNAAGEITHEETYSSNYRPWAAKYLVGQ